ncbi:hypothetical protein H5410_027681, partial [Solanum commersonii]
VNDGRLCTAGEASQRSTKEDWAEWMRHFNIELSKESPSAALRTCARLAQLLVLLVVGHNLLRLVRSLEMAFSSPNIPPEILATLLNLVSFSIFFNFEDIDPLMFSRKNGVNVKLSSI